MRTETKTFIFIFRNGYYSFFYCPIIELGLFVFTLIVLQPSTHLNVRARTRCVSLSVCIQRYRYIYIYVCVHVCERECVPQWALSATLPPQPFLSILSCLEDLLSPVLHRNFNLQDSMGMADGHASYPSVFVVDSGTKFPPPLPPKPGQTRIQNRRKCLIQNTLLVLVCLALLGLLVEGYFIYKLHKTNTTSESVSENAGVLSITAPSTHSYFQELMSAELSHTLTGIMSLSLLSVLQHSFLFLINGVVLNCDPLSLLHTVLKHITHGSWIK